MSSPALACPHCGASLNFSMEIAAGASVECLICMGVFVAHTHYVPAARPQTVPSADSKPEAVKPEAHETVTDMSVPNLPRPAAEPSRPRIPVAKPAKARPAPQRPAPPASHTIWWMVPLVAAGLLLPLMLIAGVVAWKVAFAPARVAAPPQLAQTPLPTPIESNNPKPVETPPPVKPVPPPIDDDDDEKRRALFEAAQNLLRRKQAPPVQVVDFQPIPALDVSRPQPFGLDQEKINLAIERGLDYLRQHQHANGTWSTGHMVGYASVGGLTLLECGVPAQDPHVQKSAAHVRANIANLTATYELSLAVLFLDRLGDPRDRLLIQGMALRLVAGQLDGGGWSYHCTRLDPQEMYQLFTFLHANRKPNFFDPIRNDPKLQKAIPGQPDGLTALRSTDPDDPFKQLNDLLVQKALGPGQANQASPKDGTPGQAKTPADDRKPDDRNKFEALAMTKQPKGKGKSNPVRPEWLKKSLQGLPAVQNQAVGKGQFRNAHGAGDNSNTQFAILALWAARRHDVPTEQAILAAYHRFTHTQNSDGGWPYHARGGSTPSMTCVGLLGEAMGHGTLPEIVRDPATNAVRIKPALEDPKVKAGLKRLSQNISEPTLVDKKLPMENLYFLWSVERVAMLYDLKTINGKDWYGWGAQILVRNQQANGSWTNSSYHGATPPLNTCFALLFLKRSNLVRDLTDNLRLQTAIRE